MAARVGLAAADSLWQGTYRQKLQRFLNNTQQETGDFILALTLGGEGRTVNFLPNLMGSVGVFRFRRRR